MLLSGGVGSRLWPLSRESQPKQFLPLVGDTTGLQATALRVGDDACFHPPIIVANAEHRFMVAEQLREIGCKDATIVLEPVGRNTAPAIAAAALIARRRDPEATILVMPADHHIGDAEMFRASVARAMPAAESGLLVLFGIKPDSPATGYGYIQPGEPVAGGARRVAAFVEKPQRTQAEQIFKAGYLWNSGVFLLPSQVLLEELERWRPDVMREVTRAVLGATRDLDFLRLDADAFAASPAISIDYAVMEQTGLAAVAECSFPWTDLGAWSALWEVESRDEDENVLVGDVLTHQAQGCYVRSDGPLVAVAGVDNLFVVATTDAVLVVAKSADQEVKAVVDALRDREHPSARASRRTYRPWGWYEQVDAGPRFQVKRIMVAPGAQLSLQKHGYRAEHWIVVQGQAQVHIAGADRILRENESVFIPVGAVHRLTNPTAAPLHLIEVQSGSYLGEDDIVRLADDYARA